MQVTERRFTTTHVRAVARGNAVANSPGTLTGYASIFNSLSTDLGGFKERVHRNAFDRALREQDDVRALINHSPDRIIGRTTNGTLRLSTDAHGLRMECDVADTSYGRDIYTSVQRGDVDAMSFAFTCDDEDWSDETDPETNSVIPVRTVKDVHLLDVSPVVYEAYPGTEVNTIDPTVLAMGRSIFPEGIPLEVRSRVPHLRHVPPTTVVNKRRSLMNTILGI